ncbi:MAG: DUF4249 domain-containing protein [Bacteroidetes bacterium]|jgi:hypothetical protein|nr:DUF4249 domain-containing protein [Bacteroidota bacterium]
MTNKKIILALSAFFSLFLFSCNSFFESDVDIPAEKPKLVVYGYLTAEDDTIKLSVQHSKPIYTVTNYFSEFYPSVTDATVKISDGSTTINLVYDAYQRKYVSAEMQVMAGKTYSLEITTPRSDRVTASCTVPASEVPVVEITSIESHPIYAYNKFINFRIKDLPGKGHFYRVLIAMFLKDIHNPEYPDYVYYIPLETGEEYFSDVNKDGEYFIFKAAVQGLGESQAQEVTFYTSITDEHYFNFHKSVLGFQGDNPFAEPTPVYSNIEGGLGVFAASKAHTFTLAY